MTQEIIFTWEGREDRLSYTPRWSEHIDHVEVHAIDGDPLPITETGYKSHFFPPVDPALTLPEVQAMVTDWLEVEAAKPAWKTYQQQTQQLNLF